MALQVFLFLFLYVDSSLSHQVKCLENGRFYRDPDRFQNKEWTSSECSKYFLCLEGEVFDFRCSQGLLFDVQKQICDLKLNVDNCDLTSASNSSSPLMINSVKCLGNQQGCADGTCLPQHYFCDGSVDCTDGTDEKYCDPKHDLNPATPCNSTCRLPDCFCSLDGTQIPGNLEPAQTPQMVVLTFDDAINFENFGFYDKFFEQFRNPNGCPIRATFFVSHENNNYYQTQKLWNAGHEIAVHSITHRTPESWWSRNASIEDWFDEMIGEANILHKYSKIRMAEIRGLRVPYLQVGWNRQFLMMKEFGFVYDSSIVAPFSNPPLWPYTLDHKIPHDCQIMKQICPTRSYPNVWQLVINQLEADGYSCPMINSCSLDFTGDDIYRILVHNFKRHYFANRAPFGLHFQSEWFKKREYLEAFQDFIAEVLQQPDVWFVTNWQVISWMKNPVATSKLGSFKAWSCDKLFQGDEIACKLPNMCRTFMKSLNEERFLHTCSECPHNYPWIRNEFGKD